MGEVGVAGGTELLSVRLHGVDIGLVEQGLVGIRVVRLDLGHKLGLAHQGALGLGGGRHGFDRGGPQGESHPVPRLGLCRVASEALMLDTIYSKFRRLARFA